MIESGSLPVVLILTPTLAAVDSVEPFAEEEHDEAS